MAGKCRHYIITQAFGEPDDNAFADEGQCCDVCDMQPHQLRDYAKELDIAVDAIHTIGPRGEVKLSKMIRGNKRPGWKHLTSPQNLLQIQMDTVKNGGEIFLQVPCFGLT